MSVGNNLTNKKMGCDIHSFAERRNKQTNKWEKVEDAFSLDNYDKERLKKDKGEHPFDWRSYSMYGFLAGVRNYSCCDPIAEPRGIPDDTTDEVREDYEGWGSDAHTPSFLTAKELLEFNYDKPVFKGSEETYRDNLSGMFFIHLEDLAKLGNPEDVRIVFWFDN